MSLSTNQSDPERVEYHEWLLRIQDQQLREELLDIVSKLFLYSGTLPFQLKVCNVVMVFLSCKSLQLDIHLIYLNLFIYFFLNSLGFQAGIVHTSGGSAHHSCL